MLPISQLSGKQLSVSDTTDGVQLHEARFQRDLFESLNHLSSYKAENLSFHDCLRVPS